jgi:hypothetical protein
MQIYKHSTFSIFGPYCILTLTPMRKIDFHFLALSLSLSFVVRIHRAKIEIMVTIVQWLLHIQTMREIERERIESLQMTLD